MPPSARIAVNAIEGLDLGRVRLVASFALLVVALGVGAGFASERRRGCGRHRGAGAQRAKELATTQRPAALLFHRRHLPRSSLCAEPSKLDCATTQAGSANASVSISVNTRPSVPIRR